MSDTRTRDHTPEPRRPKPNLRALRQRGIAQQRRNEKTLRDRYEADDRRPDDASDRIFEPKYTP